MSLPIEKAASPNDVSARRGAVRLVPIAERGLAAIAALCLCAMMALTFIGVIARYFLDRPIAGDSEIQGFLLGLIIFSALPLVTSAERHIAVHSFAGLLRGRAALIQRGFVRLVTALGLGFIAYLLFLQGKALAEDGSTSSFLDIPEAPFAYFFAALALLAALMAAALVCQSDNAESTRADEDGAP